MPSAEAMLQQAWTIHRQGQVTRAEQVYRQVLSHLPSHAAAWCYLGIALHDQRRYADAIAAYQEALRLQPDFPIALNNLGNSLRYEYRAQEAEESFRKAIALKPDYVNAHKNRGTLHVWDGRLEQARESFEAARQLAPHDAELHRNLGVLNLLQGRFSEGWEEYRWRWKCPEMPRPSFNQPVWEGQEVTGKTVLLYSEQGLGDTLHFIRFAQVLHQRGARVLVHGAPALTALLCNLPYIHQWIPQTLAVTSEFDYHASLVDAADVLRVDLSNIPAEVPYLHGAPYLVDYWRGWMAGLPQASKRVGIAWQGNRDHQADKFRSVPLKHFERLAVIPGIQLISLQQGHGTEQLADWKGATPIIRLPDGVDQSNGAFMDTAAIMHHLDWIVTSDTSIAHLAGALARPTCVLLSLVPDWRWLLQRHDSPWYPTLQLCRQSQQGEWPPVLDQAAHVLSRLDPSRAAACEKPNRMSDLD